jgi:hypothetical protein
VTDKRQQSVLITGYEIIGLTRFRKAQEKIIARIGRAFDVWQCADDLSEVLQLVTRAFSLLLCTGKCSEVRLFLRKSRDGIGCVVYTRSENAVGGQLCGA